jgi:hypothetical protein
MGNMEIKELTHLQERKPSGRENQGSNNISNTRNGAEPQLPDWKSATHRPGLPHPGSLPPKRRAQQHMGRMATTTPVRRVQLDTTSDRVPQVKF